MKAQKTFKTNNKTIPYYHFKFQGDFSHILKNSKNNKKSHQLNIANKEELRIYLIKEVYKQFDFSKYEGSFPCFSKAMIVIIQSFNSLRNQDLDNFQYKIIVDTIRKTRIIDDDTWKDCSLMYLGKHDSNSEINTLIIPHEHFVEFLSNSENEVMKDIFDQPTVIQSDDAKRKESIHIQRETNSFFGIEE
ncbi:hypothetical protein ACTWQB_14435 [Piscibacillus sp. B03]|uniref:hypothetical protein n=1 Tax=Piscibacillus sp. B03 TaxID=3457430 RepID=UPI003FCE296C